MVLSRVVSEIFNVEKCCDLEIGVKGDSSSSEPTRIDPSAIYDFILTFHSNHGPISHRFRDRRRFQLKFAKFSNPGVFYARTDWLPLELGIGARGQKTRMLGYQIVEIETQYQRVSNR